MQLVLDLVNAAERSAARKPEAREGAAPATPRGRLRGYSAGGGQISTISE